MIKASTFRGLVTEASLRFGRLPFLIDDQQLGTVSYSDLLRFYNGLDRQFNELGIPPGAHVATLFHNCGIAALLFLGIIASRRVLVPLNPLSTAYELTYALDRAQCTAVIVDPTHAKSSDWAGRRALPVPDHRAYFAECSSADTSVNPREEVGASDDLLVGEIVFTSGSTGRPKGIMLSERSLLANASALASVYSLQREDRFLTVCPLFHNSGQVFTTLACALTGGSTAAVKSDLGMLNFWSYVDRHRPHWAFGMNSFLAMLLSRQESPNNPGSVRALLTGGSAIDGSLVQRFESRFGVPVRTVYGMTETSSISTCEYLDPEPRSLGSSGRPLPGCEVRIDGTSTSAMSSGIAGDSQQGEILISGANLFEYYVGDPELTLRRKSGGWLRTGDVGYFDKKGNLYVVDRIDSMLIVGGENVYPAEVEKLVTLLPNAAQIVLAGINHPIWGKELVLVYKTTDDTVPPTGVWHRIFAGQLSSAKIPQRYVSVRDLGLTDLPRKENGKLDRQAVAALLNVHAL